MNVLMRGSGARNAVTQYKADKSGITAPSYNKRQQQRQIARVLFYFKK